MPVRRLTGADAAIFREIRLQGLRDRPDAFASSWEEEEPYGLSWFRDRLETSYVAGCDIDGALVGVAGLARNDRIKTKHRGMLWGMYVAPQARRIGVGEEILQNIIDVARGGLEDLTLTVSAHNEGAIRLYRRLGFVEFGFDPKAVKIDDQYIDELLMRLAL